MRIRWRVELNVRGTLICKGLRLARQNRRRVREEVARCGIGSFTDTPPPKDRSKNDGARECYLEGAGRVLFEEIRFIFGNARF